jgi:hypothetical protein
MFWMSPSAAWLFHNEPSSGHAILLAATLTSNVVSTVFGLTAVSFFAVLYQGSYFIHMMTHC